MLLTASAVLLAQCVFFEPENGDMCAARRGFLRDDVSFDVDIVVPHSHGVSLSSDIVSLSSDGVVLSSVDVMLHSERVLLQSAARSLE